MSILSKPYFHDETAAYEKLESIVWPNGPVCPHCGGIGRIYALTGKTTRVGLRKCGQCRQQFTAKVGTVFEFSHVPLHKWLQAAFLMASSKKGISSNQLHRTLGVTLKTAWFMSHRLREAMTDGGLLGPLGGEGKQVEVDETFIGRKPGRKVRQGSGHKHAVVSLVERGGKLRSFHVERVNAATVRKALVTQVDRASTLNTDEADLL